MVKLPIRRSKKVYDTERFKIKPPRTRLGRRIKDPFGNIILLKGALISLIGIATYRRLNIVNKMKIEGMEILKELPNQNVLFVSNHQTYFADVFALNHIFSSNKWGMKDINFPIYLLMPRVRSYYIAEEETMKTGGLLPRIFSYAGAVTVKRSWRRKGENKFRRVDKQGPLKIKAALKNGWVINFPQGTTTENSPIRRGVAKLIKDCDPIVVPVKIAGFNKAFDKRGLKFKEKGVELSVTFDQPVQFGNIKTWEEIHWFLENAILE